MNCQEIEIQLMEYVARELPSSLNNKIALHLTHCSACRQELEREETLGATLGNLPQTTQVTTIGFAYPDPPGKWWLPISGGVIAATILMTFLISHQATLKPAQPAHGSRELAIATAEVKWTLTLASSIIQTKEKATIKHLLGTKLPAALSSSLFLDKENQNNS